MQMKTLKARLVREEGWLVLTAVMVTTMMLGVGLAIFSTVGTQQSQSRQERNRDSAFNLAESALYAQAFILSRNWPQTANAGWSCNQTVTTDGLCPSYASLQNAVDGSNIPDLKSGIAWRLTVSDNGKTTPTTDYITNPSDPNYTTAAWDANGDKRIWVRADGWAQGKERSLVALLQLEQFKEPFPQNVITAGHFQTDNQGNKVLINTLGNSATGSQVVVHCASTDPTCSQTRDPVQVQVGPAAVQYSPPAGGDTSQIPTAMTASELARFQAAATSNGTYFTSCPSTLQGSVVFIDFPSYSSSNTCTYVGNSTWNSPTSPGLLIIRNGVLSVGGTTTFYGLVYAPNPSCTSDNLVETQGNTHIFGGVAIDCTGGLDVGSSHENVTFDSSAFNNLKTTGAAGLVQNTWRELPAGTP
jgi:type II secretory pathway pseudopilin PulG